MKLDNSKNKTASTNIIGSLLEKYLPYWPLFLLLSAISIAAAYLYSKVKLPVYETTASVLIKDEKKGIEDSKTMESLNPLSGKKIIENEIEIIKSKSLVDKVVKGLKLYAPIYKKEKWKDVSAYRTSPIAVELKVPDSLQEMNKIAFNYDAANSVVKINGTAYPVEKWVNTTWGVMKFDKTKVAATSKGSFYFNLIDPKRVGQDIIKRLDVSASGKLSSVIYLKIKDEIPQRSEDILDGLVQVYDQAGITDKNLLAANALSFLDERLRIVSQGLDSIEKKLQLYRSSRGAIDISTQGKLFLQNVSENDQKLTGINTKISVLGQIEQFIFSDKKEYGLVPTAIGIDEPVLSGLLSKLYDTELQQQQMANAGENNPQTIVLNNQVQKLKSNILENVRSQKVSLESSRNNINSTNNGYTSVLRNLPQQERDIVEISREQNIKSAIYTFLLQRREEVALSYSSTVSDSRIIDHASSSFDPVGIGGTMLYIIAIIIAIGITTIIITLKELAAGRIINRQEIEAITSYPIVGEIVLQDTKQPLISTYGNPSVIAEEFRLLRTSLQYLGIGANAKNILVTSTLSGEGKSFVAVNLALSLSMGGKKVILVEFDLTNPTLSKKIGVTNQKGITDYLMGNARLDEIIIKAGDNDGLYLITAGNLTENPSDLILKQSTPDLLNELKQTFDFVVVDSAPVGILSDAYILSKYCDATLYIVRQDYTNKSMLERMEQNSKINEMKNLGIVFNAIRSQGFGQNNYKYMYHQDQKMRKRNKFNQ